ncbi:MULTISPECIES: GNAT family N-acetyltransferase [Thermoanaerobacterium]|uniref:GNAT family N-acetyltransferase n=1 Tax=Thermoanaerobacterium TaxID=28895 RepID=UPI001CC1D5C7|nr:MULTISPECIES: GNAT family N-acetyltransferase [Thermoanaerobacterium]
MLSEIKAPFKEKIKKFLEEDNEDYLECSVYPDIIIHKRNSNNNLLAIEVKKQYSNEKDDKFDDQKLKKYTHGDGFGYKYGAFIKLGKSCEEIDIIWYKNGMPYNYNINPGDCIMNIKIREALFNDYESISILVKEVHSLHVKNRRDVYADVENPFTEERFKEILSDGKTKVFVAEDCNNEIIAYNIIEIMTARNIPILKERKFVYIDDLCVSSTHRRKGVGRMLFKHIVDYAKKSGYDALELTVWEFNSDAIKFYENLGMTTRNRRMELKIN